MADTSTTIPLNRLTDAVKNGDYNGVANDYTDTSSQLSLLYGGYGGWSPKLGRLENKKWKSEWISNQAHIKRNVVPIVLQYPKFFHFFSDPDKWIKTYKALLEVHMLTIEGLNGGLTVEFDETPVGGAGEMQEDLTNVTRNRTTVSYTYKERLGKPIQRFWDTYIRYGLMDPDTKHALVGTLKKYVDSNVELYTADYMSGTVLFFEPDLTHTKVMEAWICTNMMPKGNGEVTGKRDKASANEGIEISIEFTSITISNLATRRFAQGILDSINIISADPNTTPVFLSKRDAKLDVDPVNEIVGYEDDVVRT